MTDDRVLNFGAGPAMLPEAVLRQARDDLLTWGTTGIGAMELSHRSAAYESIQAEAEATLRRLLDLDDEWAVLFLQGGASLQFAMVPMNLGPGGDHVLTGPWAVKAHAEAERLGPTRVAATSAPTGFDRIPRQLDVHEDAAYLHITSNNTIVGTQLHDWPQVDVPLVCDASSDILSRPLPVDRLGLVYAGAQKNLGPAGVTLVLVRKELLDTAPANLPTMLRYATHAAKASRYNTPPTFAVHVVGLVARWVEQEGGLEAMAARAEARARRLYEVIDRHDLYEGAARPEDRSRMNVTFRLAEPDRVDALLAATAEAGMVGLRGHRSVGGLRASIYNAMPQEGVDRLADLLEAFAR